MKPEDRTLLIQALSKMGSQGRAESEPTQTFSKTFYPVSDHLQVFDPDAALIIGDRGSGKSELFRAVVQENLLPAILRQISPSRTLFFDPAQGEWLAGYPMGTKFVDASGLRRVMEENNSNPDVITDLWFAYLIRITASKMDDEAQSLFSLLLNFQGGDVDRIFSNFNKLRSEPLLAMDRLDEGLRKSDRWLFISYDELDTLGGYDWKAMDWAIRGLIDFWVNYSRRWQRIRAKIFIRTDLYRRHSQTYGADLIKLASNRVELTWNDRNLYAMLIKRMANSSPELTNYCKNGGMRLIEDQQLGFIPQMSWDEDARKLIEMMIGPYMGANVNKGQTFNWLLDHIRDGKGAAVPRPLVRLIELAALQEINLLKASTDRLLHPTALRRALDEVSKEHVLQVNTHELPWLSGVAQRLDGASVPMSQREVENLLEKDWNGTWGLPRDVAVRPGFSNKQEMVNYLLEIGVFRHRGEEKLDVPDLYMSGLGMKRKGGVRRK
ncbi:MAG: hypothetical protein MUP03_01320 [Anaerolineales bacterium]|nr:hypothetical protein [Anaerolineales bacterium]